MKVVSACLANVKCRYDGNAKPSEKVIELLRKGEAILVCPEQLGGLPTPRIPSEQKGSLVLTKEGNDVTAEYKRGAEEALKIAETAGCKEAVLKTKSPACGSGQVYDGNFTGTLKEGDGVFARLLKENGIKVVTEDEV